MHFLSFFALVFLQTLRLKYSVTFMQILFACIHFILIILVSFMCFIIIIIIIIIIIHNASGAFLCGVSSKILG